MPRIHLVSCVAASQKAVHDIMVTSPIVGMSCKGAIVAGKATIYLVVIATLSGDVYAFDVRKVKDIVLEGGLVRIAQSFDVLKVIHDSAPDTAALQQEFGVALNNIFDTQVAYRVLMEENGLSPRMLSKVDLFNDCDVTGYTPSPELQRLLREDRHVWARRPLNKDMLNTAAADVVPLVTTLYGRLRSVLKPETVEWFEYLVEQHSRGQLRQKKKVLHKGDNPKKPSIDNDKYAMAVVRVKPPRKEPMYCY